jgi:hypothetical protein
MRIKISTKVNYPEQWEYKRIWWEEIYKAPYYGSLDPLGKDGWELVVIEHTQYEIWYYFKRPLGWEPPTRKSP